MLPREWYTARREARFRKWISRLALSAHTRYILLRYQSLTDGGWAEVLADAENGVVPGIGAVRIGEIHEALGGKDA